MKRESENSIELNNFDSDIIFILKVSLLTY